MSVVHANVVTYNPDLAQLTDSLKLLLKQTDLILVVNNSPEPLDLHIEGVHILELGENLGIARAQSIAMQWSFERDADFILQMDQDSTPNPNMVIELVSSYQRIIENRLPLGVIGPVNYDRVTNVSSKPRIPTNDKSINDSMGDLFEVDVLISSGTLIPREIYTSVGCMADDMFIDLVDFEYCWRIKKAGYKVYREPKAKLAHRLGNGKARVLFFVIDVSSPFRHYYSFRNTIWLIANNKSPMYWNLRQFPKMLYKLIFYPLILPEGRSRFYFMCKGIKDGFKGIMGRMR